jgi:hypothetical protein
MLNKNDFVEIVQNIFLKKDFEELNNMIIEGNYSIELILKHFVQLEDSPSFLGIEENEIFFAIVYNRNVFLTRSEFRSSFEPKPKHSKEQVITDLVNISKKLIFLYRLNFFSELENLLFKYSSEQEEVYSNLYKTRLVAVDILFRINGIEVFCITGTGATEEEIQEMGYDLKYFREEIKADSDLPDITRFNYFSNLSEDAKFFIEAGNQLLSTFLENSGSSFNDYSPFLLDFLKSLEIEIKEFYLKFYNKIYGNAKLISIDINFKIQLNIESDITHKEELNYLFNLSKQITTFRKNYSPSGIKPLYYFIKYFAFNNNLKFIEGYSGFIFQVNDSFLTKNENLILRLKNMGELRNKTIHSNLIGSKEEFLMNYYDIVIALQLITTLKSYNS